MSARAYSVNGPSATGTANKTAVNVIGTTAVRPRVSEFVIGVTTAPNATDQQLEFGIGRTTAAGTAGSSPTPLAIDGGNVAAVCTAGITHSVEPTYAATYFFDQAMNQRGLFRWVASPGYELYGTASAANGIGLKNIAILATAVTLGTIIFSE